MLFSLEITPFGDPVAQALCAEVQAEYAERYDGSGDETVIEDDDFCPPNGDFLVAYSADGQPVGCGAWRSHGEHDAEMKRIYVRPAARRQGLARKIVAAVENSAAQAGRKRIILETGPNQPEAIAMYEILGYKPVEPFGHYACEDGSVHLGRELRSEENS